MMKPSRGSEAKLEQSGRTSSVRASDEMSPDGPASCDVPVSTATRQSSQKDCRFPSTVMSSILTSQYPVRPVMSTQKSSDAMWSCLMSPNVISEVSWSESERKTEKSGFRKAVPSVMRDIKLNDGPCAILSRARPKTPSKWNDAKGWSVSSVEEMKAPTEQVLPMQIWSAKHLPV